MVRHASMFYLISFIFLSAPIYSCEYLFDPYELVIIQGSEYKSIKLFWKDKPLFSADISLKNYINKILQKAKVEARYIYFKEDISILDNDAKKNHVVCSNKNEIDDKMFVYDEGLKLSSCWINASNIMLKLDDNLIDITDDNVVFPVKISQNLCHKIKKITADGNIKITALNIDALWTIEKQNLLPIDHVLKIE